MTETQLGSLYIPCGDESRHVVCVPDQEPAIRHFNAQDPVIGSILYFGSQNGALGRSRREFLASWAIFCIVANKAVLQVISEKLEKIPGYLEVPPQSLQRVNPPHGIEGIFYF